MGFIVNRWADLKLRSLRSTKGQIKGHSKPAPILEPTNDTPNEDVPVSAKGNYSSYEKSLIEKLSAFCTVTKFMSEKLMHTQYNNH